MSSSKRERSPDQEESRMRDSKTAKILDGGAAKNQASHEVIITVKTLSPNKAMRNDPFPFGLNDSSELPPVVEGPPHMIHHAVRRPVAGHDGQYDIGSAPSEDANPDDDAFIPPENIEPLDEMSHLTWLEHLDAFAFVGGKTIAICRAKLIRRDQILGSFWREVEEVFPGVTGFFFGVFDRCGRLNRHLYEHEVRKGTGVWGAELDHGDIVVFDFVVVKAPWRRQRIASKLVGAILNLMRVKSTNFVAFVCPGLLSGYLMLDNQEEEPKARNEALRLVEDFWRSLGFRRLGIIKHFAFTDDAKSPSRSLLAALDCDEPDTVREQSEIPGIIVSVVDALRSRQISDTECIRRIRKAFPNEEWSQTWLAITDRAYNTLLHTAFDGAKPRAISHILSVCPRLANVRNNFGYTPIEWAGTKMELTRTYRAIGPVTNDRSDSFNGFEYETLASLAALRRIRIADLRKLTDEDIAKVWLKDEADSGPETALIRITLRMKYGCTCGTCIGGFLSPRMRFTLHSVARTIGTLLDPALHSRRWNDSSEDAARHLTRTTRTRLAQHKTLRQGFVEVYQQVARCLADLQLPTETKVQTYCGDSTQESQRVTRTYLRNGGTVSAVVVSIIEASMAWDEWIGNRRRAKNSLEGIYEFPACRNDHEYEFVSGMCGFKRKYRLMPHWWN